MRFLAAPWDALLSDELWLRYARSANGHARELSRQLASIPGVAIINPTEANAVFASLPESAHAALQERGWRYYRFIGGGARFMCSWATTAEDVQALAADVRNAVEIAA
jgi:threonine aldolase